MRQEGGLSRDGRRGPRVLRRQRVSDQQRRLFADLRRLAAHVPLRVQTRLQADQQQHMRRFVHYIIALIKRFPLFQRFSIFERILFDTCTTNGHYKDHL